MTAGNNPFKRIRLVYRRSSKTVKCVVLATVIVATVTLLALTIAIGDAKREAQALRSEAIALEQENAQLSEDIDGLGTINGIKELAKKLLGLVDPDTVIFDPE